MTFNRAIAPEPLKPLSFEIPDAVKTTLANGMRVVIFNEPRLPLVSYRLAFLTGESSEPSNKIGVTSALTTLLTEGTVEHTSQQLAEKIERLGASLGASTSDDFTIVSASCLSFYSEDILGTLAEIIFSATFPENELDLYKRNMLENIKFQRSQPNFLAGEQVAKALYGDHPYGVVSPTAEDIEKITREDLLEAARKRVFDPSNAIFIAVGDVGDDFLSKLEHHFGDWKSEAEPRQLPSEPHLSRDKRLILVDRPGSSQANIVLANPAVKRNHEDYFPNLVMNQILGAGASSRIFMNLREEKGYTYGAYSRFDLRKLSGIFEATAEVRTEVTRDALNEFFYELNRIRDEKVLQEELDDAKNFLTGVFPLRAETQEGLTNLLVGQELHGLPEDYLKTYRKNVDAVTIDDVSRVADKYVRPGEMTMVIVGDVRGILPFVNEMAEDISIFDKDRMEMNMSDYVNDPDAAIADVSGEWELSLDFQGQNVKVMMVLQQDGTKVTGKITTPLGEGVINEGQVSGNSVSAVATAKVYGMKTNFNISGTIIEKGIKGNLSASMIPTPLEFSGSKKS